METLFWEEASERDDNTDPEMNWLHKHEKRLKRKAALRYFFTPTDSYYEERKAFDEYMEELADIQEYIINYEFKEENNNNIV